MKIEEYKGYKITDDDISYLKDIYEKKEKFTLVDKYNDEIVNVFENLVLNTYDHNSFVKLALLSERLIRNGKEPKEFELGLKISYNLIDLGEKELEKNDDHILGYRLSDLYLILSFIINDSGFKTLPYWHMAEKYNIKKDDKLALSYLQKAILLNPNSNEIKLQLGMYYYNKKNYYFAYDYLIGVKDVYSGKWPYFEDKAGMAHFFTEMGVFFDNNKNGNLNGYRVFWCFKASYLLLKDEENIDKDTFISTRYNMACAYYKGIGVQEDHKEGKKYLDELALGLSSKYNEDILKINDPDGIIKEYYKPE